MGKDSQRMCVGMEGDRPNKEGGTGAELPGAQAATVGDTHLGQETVEVVSQYKGRAESCLLLLGCSGQGSAWGQGQ